jgi:hypothetical protein
MCSCPGCLNGTGHIQGYYSNQGKRPADVPDEVVAEIYRRAKIERAERSVDEAWERNR